MGKSQCKSEKQKMESPKEAEGRKLKAKAVKPNNEKVVVIVS